MNKKKNAVMLADTRPALAGTVLIQLEETNKGLFDEAVIYYLEEICDTDKKLMQSIMPCRFIKYKCPLSDEVLNKPRFRLFSPLMFARYEMMQYLDEFETITWLDTDILIQGRIDGFIDAAKKSGAAFIREDPIHKTAEKTDRMRTCFHQEVKGYNLDEYLYCSGTITYSDQLGKIENFADWCYQKTYEWADALDLPDQGVLNAAIQNFHIQAAAMAGKVYCCYPYMNRDCSEAKIIHAWGLNKFWNDWYVYKNYSGWSEKYDQWTKRGGSRISYDLKPEVSVVIPSYKPDMKFLKQCLDSLMKQTRNSWERYSDFEIIIVSEPFDEQQITQLVNEYQDKRIRLIFNKERLGIAASLNKGIKEAQGRYIARIDDDDCAAASRLYLQKKYLEEHKEISLCTTDFEYFGDMSQQRISFEGEMSRAWAMLTCPFDHPTVMFRKSFFATNHLWYDENQKYAEDWDLWLRAFEKGMAVGCIHEILLYHRWHNGSAGQTDASSRRMKEIVQNNFRKLGVEIPWDYVPVFCPWWGRAWSDEALCFLRESFQKALAENERLGLYEQESLRKVFDLRLTEAETGVLPGLSRSSEVSNMKEVLKSEGKKPGWLRTVCKRILKPLYQPFRHRYEDRLIRLEQELADQRAELRQGLADQVAQLRKVQETLNLMQLQTAENVSGIEKRILEGMELSSDEMRRCILEKMELNFDKTNLCILEKLESNLDETHRHIDFDYRDIMTALNQQITFLPENHILLKTEWPIAYESLDHLYPHGTIRDNTRYPRFVKKCEELFLNEKRLSFLDLGCSGGGMVLEAALRGHISFGLEGSDSSKKEQRAEWRLLGDRLQTCDITKPFLLQTESNEIQQFDIITAWEVLEHIAEQDLPQLFENIKKHLTEKGYFIGSIANWDDIDPVSGVNWHVTVHPYDWWEEKFSEAGFVVCTKLFDAIDLARGGYNPPHCYERPYPDIDMEKTFHIVVHNSD